MQDNIISYQDMPGFLISINKKHGSFKKKIRKYACMFKKQQDGKIIQGMNKLIV